MRDNIPEQFAGKQLDYAKTVECPSAARAEAYFDEIRQRLLDVNNWEQIANGSSAEFHIVDAANQVVDRAVREGDRIRIDIPGPGLPSAKGYDWVRVEKITTEENVAERQIMLTLRPCPDPTNENPDTAHFFTLLATSTFLLRQSGRQVLIRYAGRNEIINTENISTWDNFRNFLIGLGAKIAGSYPQWKGLVEGLADVHSDTSSA